METLTNIALAIIAIVAVVVIVQDRREQKFLENLRPFLVEQLPLYDALLTRATYIFYLGLYLLVLTAAGAILAAADKPQVAEVFPPIRAINALLFLGLLAGPIFYGRALRRLPNQQRPSGPPATE